MSYAFFKIKWRTLAKNAVLEVISHLFAVIGERKYDFVNNFIFLDARFSLVYVSRCVDILNIHFALSYLYISSQATK